MCRKACGVPGVSRASALPGTKFVRQAAKTYDHPTPLRVLPTGMPCGYVEARRRRRRETLPEGFRFTRPALLRVLPRGTPCGCVEARRRGRCETLPEGLYSHPPGRKAGKCTWSDRDRFRAGRVATFHPPTAARMTSPCRRFPRGLVTGAMYCHRARVGQARRPQGPAAMWCRFGTRIAPAPRSWGHIWGHIETRTSCSRWYDLLSCDCSSPLLGTTTSLHNSTQHT